MHSGSAHSESQPFTYSHSGDAILACVRLWTVLNVRYPAATYSTGGKNVTDCPKGHPYNWHFRHPF
jgi:hypothetical protein